MEGEVNFSFDEFSSDEERIFDDEQETYFPSADDVFEAKSIFLPNLPVIVDITHIFWTRRFPFSFDRTRSPSRSQNLTEVDEEDRATSKVPSRYEITLSHGPYQWKVLREQSEFSNLQFEIFVYQVKRRMRNVGHALAFGDRMERKQRKKIASLPRRPIFGVSDGHIEERKQQLQAYLQSIVDISQLRDLECVQRFFEISPLTFRMRLGISKFKEGYILKIPKARRLAFRLFPCCISECFWQGRWILLKDSYLVVLKPQKSTEDEERRRNSVISEDSVQVAGADQLTHTKAKRWHRSRYWRYCKVFLIDQFFNYRQKDSPIGPILQIVNMHGEINLRTQHSSSLGEWMYALTRAASQPEAQGYLLPNPHKSFAPARTDGTMMLCIDGATYMDSVAEAISQARYEIFITDWWLSPEIFLKRPSGADKWRLDLLLKRKAESGVRVCILIYREVSKVLTINSRYSSKYLSSLHRNIHVIRHPDHIRESILFWSHHEKIVVIDQSIAFMGGIDLCYGRWDRQDHPLFDYDRTAGYVRNVVKPVQVTDLAPKSMLLALLPFGSELPVPATDTAHSDILLTDAPAEEVGRDARGRNAIPTVEITEAEAGEVPSRPSLHALANAAKFAKAWRSKAAVDVDKPCVTFRPDGQLVLQSSIRRRQSSKYNAFMKEETVDIHVPNVGRVPMLIDSSKKTPNKLVSPPVVRRYSTVRKPSSSRPLRVRSYSTATCTELELNSHTSAIPLTVRSPLSPSRRNKKSSAVETNERLFSNVGNKLQVLFGRHGSIRHRSPSINSDSDDSDNSDNLEYTNVGFFKRRQSRFSTVGAQRRPTMHGRLDEEADSIFGTTSEPVESYLSSLSHKFLFVGKDYGNWMLKDAVELDKPEEDLIDRTNIPRMPWHDCGCAVSGRVASDFARHFIQRWNATRTRKVKRRRKQGDPGLPVPPMLLPCPPCEPWIHTHLSTVSGKRRALRCKMQALRSASQWSLVASGKQNSKSSPNNLDITPEYTERSILNAYVQAILESEHYIYIENQFFVSWLNEDINNKTTLAEMSKLSGDAQLQSSIVQNTITQAIYERVLRAASEKKNFRVYIILPLLPGFEGDCGSRQTGISIHAVLHYVRESLFRGPTALIPRLQLKINRPFDYISVCGLRAHGIWPDGVLATELIYVHSKLMIVDDRKLIIGSANINDRSLIGYRDSEVAIIAEDTADCGTLTEAIFDGRPVMVGKLAQRFRKSLMAEHLGVLTEESRNSQGFDYSLLDDPVCEKFFHHVWLKTANSNMELFEKIFSCLPSDNLHSFEEVKIAREQQPLCERSPAEALELSKKIRGHLVRYPEDFLIDEDLSPPIGSKENMISVVIWT